MNRPVIGAHYGLRDWLAQRVTAVLMLIYTAALVVFLLAMPADYAGWQALFGQVWVKVFSQITLLALLLHVWVGIRDVWMDYVKPVGVRLSLHVFTIVWLLACAVYSANILWGL